MLKNNVIVIDYFILILIIELISFSVYALNMK